MAINPSSKTKQWDRLHAARVASIVIEAVQDGDLGDGDLLTREEIRDRWAELYPRHAVDPEGNPRRKEVTDRVNHGLRTLQRMDLVERDPGGSEVRLLRVGRLRNFAGELADYERALLSPSAVPVVLEQVPAEPRVRWEDRVEPGKGVVWRPWREVARLRGEIEQARSELRELRRDLAQAERQIEHRQNLINELLEPEGGEDGCVKIRLANKEEALAFAARLERRNGAPAGTLMVYRCRHCPRHPVHQTRYFHVAHDNENKRGQGSQQYAQTRPKAGPTIGQRVDPTVLAKLKRPGTAY